MTHKLTRLAALVLAVVMAFSVLLVPASAASFNDVSGNAWYKAAVDYVQERGWMAGVSETSFAPNKEVTRGMMVTVLARVAGAETDNETAAFTDTASGKWYTGAAAWAAENGIVAGVGNGLFAPNRAITRQDLCVMLYKYISLKSYELKNDVDRSFSDMESVLAYAREAVLYCAGVGLVSGFEDGSFRPKDTATRAQIAQMMMRLDLLVKGEEAPAEPMPAQSFDGEAGEDMSVSVNAPEGALPENTKMDVTAVTHPAALTAISKKVNGVILGAADITFTRDGAALEPSAEVEVRLALANLENVENPKVVHIKSDGTAESVNAELVSGERSGRNKELRFFAKDFSVYAVYDGEIDYTSRLLIQFWMPVFNQDGTFELEEEPQESNSVFVARADVTNPENVDYLPTIVPDPTVPQPSGKLEFFGWSFHKEYEVSEADGAHTINYVRDQIKKLLKDEANDIADVPFEIRDGVTVVNVYPIVYNYFAVSYKDENGDASLGTDVYYTHDSSVDITVQQQYLPFEQGYRFVGWQVQGQDDRTYENGDPYTVTETETVFIAQVQEGYWLSFVENPGNHYRGASYTPPIFCPDGVIPGNARPTNPSLNGYSFGGWYATFNQGPSASADTWSDSFSFSGTISQDTTVYAKWNPNATVPYSVIVWKQSVNDDKNAADAAKTYDFAFAAEGSAAPGTAISALNLSAYQNKNGQEITVDGETHSFLGFKYNTVKGVRCTDTAVQINGSTVINLYYDRELVTLEFYIPGNTYTADPNPDFNNNAYFVYDSSTGTYEAITGYNNTFKRGKELVTGSLNSSLQGTYTSGGTTYIEYAYCIFDDDGGYALRYHTTNDGYRYQWTFSKNDTTYVYTAADYPDARIYRLYRTAAYTFYYRNYTRSTTMSGLYGQAIDTYSGYSWPEGYWWYEGVTGPGNTRTTFLAEFLPAGTNMTINYYGETGSGTNHIYWYTQDVNGTSYSQRNTATSSAGSFNLSDKYSGFTCISYSLTGADGSWTTVGRLMSPDNDPDSLYYDANPNEEGYQAVANYTNLYIRFARNTYGITYNYGVFVDGNNAEVTGLGYAGMLHHEGGIFYEAPLDDHLPTAQNSRYYDPVAEGDFTNPGFVFEGWYQDPACTVEYSFAGKEMPLDGITLYGKFRQVQYRVFLEPNVPEDASVTWNDPNQAMNFRITYQEAISDGQPIDGVDTTGNYVLVGWYLDEDCTEVFNFSTRLTDEIAEPYDKTTDMTEFPENGTPYNGDLSRFWITKKVVIYAKWRKILQGASGIQVVYDAVESSETGHSGKFVDENDNEDTTWNDPLSYIDQADAIARSASNPDLPEDWQFLYWDILDAEGNPSGEIVYPGGLYTVDASKAAVRPAGSQTPGSGASETGNAWSGWEKEAADLREIAADAAPAPANPNAAAPATPITAGGEVWEPTTSITTGEEYLIGFVNGSDVYLLVNYNALNSSYPYYYPFTTSGTLNGVDYTDSYREAYLAKAVLDGSNVTGVNDANCATDLTYCKWLFSTTNGGRITSGYQSNRYLYFNRASTSGGGTYDETWSMYPYTSSTTWTWNSGGRLSTTLNNSTYYLSLYAHSDGFCYLDTTTTSNTGAIQLYKKAPMSLDDALNVDGGTLHFTTSETYPWFVPANESYAQSGNYNVARSNSYLYLTLDMQAGDTLSFRYYVSSESGYDFLVFHDDGTENYNSSYVFRESGTVNWTTYTYTAASNGTYNFVWQYRKDGSTNDGNDCARVDDVEFIQAHATYTVTFVDWDGTVLKTQTVAEGESATPPADPTREGYTFSGWSGNYTNVTQDETVTATYTENAAVGYYVWTPTDTIEPGKEYLIGFVVDGTVYLALNQNQGTSYYYENISSNYYGYTAPATLDGVNVVGVTGNATDLDYATWIFSESTGGTIQSKTRTQYFLHTFSSTNYPDLYPANGTSNGTGWTWNSGNKTLSRMVGNTRRYAQYHTENGLNLMQVTSDVPSNGTVQLYGKVFVEPAVYHTVTFIDGYTGTVFGTQEVEDGADAVAPTPPDHSGEYYFFDHWNREFTNVTEDIEVVAVYRFEREGYYTVTFKNWNGAILKTEEVASGASATAPADPTRSGYTFIGWDKDFSNVTSNLVVRARFSMTVTHTYTLTLRAHYGPAEELKTTHVTWYANNGTDGANSRKDSETVVINGAIVIEDQESFVTLSNEGYVFLGWARLPENPEAANIEGYSGRYTTYADGEKINAYSGLTAADLWLVYHPEEDETEAYYTVMENGAELENEKPNNAFEYIAANERMPYHGLYAVWQRDVFYVLHSSDGKLEAVSMPVNNSTGTAVEGLSYMVGTADLQSFVRPGYLYGGYYTDVNADGFAYGYVAHDVVQAVADNYSAAQLNGWSNVASTASTDTAAVIGTNDLNTALASSGGFIEYTGACLYTNGTNKAYVKNPDGSYVMDPVTGKPKLWPAVWNGADAGTVNGTSLRPEPGKVYYLKEVAPQYLTSKMLYTYDTEDGNKLLNLWLVTLLDDNNYKCDASNTGFYVNSGSAETTTASDKFQQKNHLSASFTITQQASNTDPVNHPAVVTTVNASSFGREGGFVMATKMESMTTANSFTMLPTWTTPDGVKVYNNGLTFTKNSDTSDGSKLYTWTRSFDGTEKMYFDLSGNHGVADGWLGMGAAPMMKVWGSSSNPNGQWLEMISTGIDDIYYVTIPAGNWTAFLLARVDPRYTQWPDDHQNTWTKTGDIQFHCSNNLNGVAANGKESYENFLMDFTAWTYDATWGWFPE